LLGLIINLVTKYGALFIQHCLLIQYSGLTVIISHNLLLNLFDNLTLWCVITCLC